MITKQNWVLKNFLNNIFEMASITRDHNYPIFLKELEIVWLLIHLNTSEKLHIKGEANMVNYLLKT